MKNFLTYLFLISLCLILYCLGYLAVGIIERNPNVIVKQDLEYLWVKTYSSATLRRKSLWLMG